MIKVTKENFYAEVVCEDRPVIVNYTADWCEPCRDVDPLVEELEKEMPEIKFCVVDVTSDRNIAIENGVTGVPTFQSYDKGIKTGELVGVVSKEEILNMVKKPEVE